MADGLRTRVVEIDPKLRQRIMDEFERGREARARRWARMEYLRRVEIVAMLALWAFVLGVLFG